VIARLHDGLHVGAARLGHGITLGLHVRRVRAPIQIGDAGLQVGVVDHQPSPHLHVAAGRRLRGDPDAVDDEIAGHGTGEVEALADGAGGGEQVVGLPEIEGNGHGA
jgi:hypothetical protein